MDGASPLSWWTLQVGPANRSRSVCGYPDLHTAEQAARAVQERLEVETRVVREDAPDTQSVICEVRLSPSDLVHGSMDLGRMFPGRTDIAQTELLRKDVRGLDVLLGWVGAGEWGSWSGIRRVEPHELEQVAQQVARRVREQMQDQL